MEIFYFQFFFNVIYKVALWYDLCAIKIKKKTDLSRESFSVYELHLTYRRIIYAQERMAIPSGLLTHREIVLQSTSNSLSSISDCLVM